MDCVRRIKVRAHIKRYWLRLKATRKKLQDVLTVQANTQVEVINSLAKVYQDWCHDERTTSTVDG